MMRVLEARARAKHLLRERGDSRGAGGRGCGDCNGRRSCVSLRRVARGPPGSQIVPGQLEPGTIWLRLQAGRFELRGPAHNKWLLSCDKLHLFARSNLSPRSPARSLGAAPEGRRNLIDLSLGPPARAVRAGPERPLSLAPDSAVGQAAASTGVATGATNLFRRAKERRARVRGATRRPEWSEKRQSGDTMVPQH